MISIDAGSRPRVAGHLLEFDDFDGQVAARGRNPAVAVADGTPGAMWKAPPPWMGGWGFCTGFGHAIIGSKRRTRRDTRPSALSKSPSLPRCSRAPV